MTAGPTLGAGVWGEPRAGGTQGCLVGGTCHLSPMAGWWHLSSPTPTPPPPSRLMHSSCWGVPHPHGRWVGCVTPSPWHMSPCMGWLRRATQPTAPWSTGGPHWSLQPLVTALGGTFLVIFSRGTMGDDTPCPWWCGSVPSVPSLA